MTTLNSDKVVEYGIKVGIPLSVVSAFCFTNGIDIGSWKAIGMVSLAAFLMQILVMIVFMPRKAKLASLYTHIWAASSVLVSLGSAIAVYAVAR